MRVRGEREGRARRDDETGKDGKTTTLSPQLSSSIDDVASAENKELGISLQTALYKRDMQSHREKSTRRAVRRRRPQTPPSLT